MLRKFGINLIRNAINPKRNFHQTSSYFAKKEPAEKAEEVNENKEKEAAKSKDSKKEPEKEKKEEKPKYVCVDKDGEIFLIGINRPEVRNAVNNATAMQICEAFMKFEDDAEAKVAVLYGVGGSFCSGYDLKELSSEDGNISTDLLMQTEGSVGPTRRHIKKPVICGIDGYCVANGLELALMCDLRVMDESATLGFFNRKFGVPIIDGGTARLPAMIGFSRALDLILTGRSVDANEALQMGLVNRIVGTGTSLGQAVKLACTIAKFPQAALNHDRNSLYSSVYDTPNFNQSVQNEVMYTSKEVMDDMTQGVRLYNEAAKIKPAKEKKAAMAKEKSMADWEKEEILKEKLASKLKEEVKEAEEEEVKEAEQPTQKSKPKGECPECGATPQEVEIPKQPFVCIPENEETTFKQLKEKCINKTLKKDVKSKICTPIEPKKIKCPDKKPKSESKKPKTELKKAKSEDKKSKDKEKDPEC